MLSLVLFLHLKFWFSVCSLCEGIPQELGLFYPTLLYEIMTAKTKNLNNKIKNTFRISSLKRI